MEAIVDEPSTPFDVLQHKIKQRIIKEKDGADTEDDQDDETQDESFRVDIKGRPQGDGDDTDNDDENSDLNGSGDEHDDGDNNGDEEEENNGEEGEDGDNNGGEEEEEEEEEEMGMFGVELETLIEIQGDEQPESNDLEMVPMIMTVIIENIIKLNGLRTEGIFRVTGNLQDVEVLAREGFDPEASPKDLPYSVHTWASLLKKWIRELPSPLIPQDLYNDLLACRSEYSAGTLIESRIQSRLARNVLAKLFIFFAQILLKRNLEQNKMTITNLATIISPTILGRLAPPLKSCQTILNNNNNSINSSSTTINVTYMKELQERQIKAVELLLMYYRTQHQNNVKDKFRHQKQESMKSKNQSKGNKRHQ